MELIRLRLRIEAIEKKLGLTIPSELLPAVDETPVVPVEAPAVIDAAPAQSKGQ